MIFDKKAKIVAKIADNRSELDFLRKLFDAGADVAWLNTAHQGEAETIEVMNKIRSITTTTPIMIDTKGPEIRIRDVEKPFEIKKGDHLIFTGDVSYTGENVVHVTYANFHNEIPVGESILYDDALIETVVVEKLPKGIRCVVNNGGLIKNKKSLNIPNVHIQLPALSEKDKSFIHFCAKNDVDFIAHSFVRNKKDLMEIKKITDQYPDYTPKIIAKIENREGFDNVRDILKYCDGLMVARGDLGAEVKLEEVPYMQKKMVNAALEAGKYSIVATQALESMIKNPRPTRAEVTDVANAILDGSGAVSMSGETAYGDFPFEATRMMGRIMKYTEMKRDDLVHFAVEPKLSNKILKDARALVIKAEKAKLTAILTVNCSIECVRALSAFRSNIPVVAGFIDESLVRETGLAYGVVGVVISSALPTSLAFHLKDSVKPNDKVMIIEEVKGKLKVMVKAFKTIK